MTLKFLADENIGASTIRFLRERKVDVNTAEEAGLLGKPDSEVLAAAKRERRAVLTHDKDFSNLLVNPPAGGSGVILLDLRWQGAQLTNEVLGRFLVGKSAAALAGRLFVVDETGVRVRE